MFELNRFADILELCQRDGLSIGQLALRYEAALSGMTDSEVLDRMQYNLEVMKQSVRSGLQPGLRSASGISGGDGYRLQQHLAGGGGFAGDFLGQVLYSALCVAETNAAMGKIVAAPTAGACGILPACLLTLQTHRDLEDSQVLLGLLNASAVGIIIAKNASIAGAEGGCQAECGSAAGMAASALTELLGGTPDMCAHACATALKSLMGLVCDPVAGLVEEPCIIRNASSAAVAVSAAQLALAGVESLIPVDQVIDAMRRVGRAMPESLRETAKGGLAATPSGKEITKTLFS